MKLGVIFGSSSTEHEVSVVSGYNVINNLDKKKYEVIPIYLDKNNNWYTCENFQIEKFGELPKKTKPIKKGLENKRYDSSNIIVYNDVREAYAFINSIKNDTDEDVYALFENDLPDTYNE